MKYELWLSDGDGHQGSSSYSFFPEDNESVRKMLEADARLLMTFEADDWNNACKQKHAFLGWDPYDPMDET